MFLGELTHHPYQEEVWWPKGELAEVLIRPIRPEDEPLMARLHSPLLAQPLSADTFPVARPN
jgi:hypothetical protein